MAVFPVDRVGKLLEKVIVACPCCLSEECDGLGIIEVIFFVGTLLVPANYAQ